jgi:tetratricopeptide (TPR) repeat protein
MHERIAALSGELERGPTSALYIRRGECHRLHGEPALARADAERALAMQAPAAGARTLLAQSLLDLKLPTEATRAADEAIRAGEDNSSSRLVRGRARGASGDAAGAAEDLGIAAAANPPDPQVLQEWIRALESSPSAGTDQAMAAVMSSLQRTGPCMSLELEAIRLERVRQAWDQALARVADLTKRYPRPGHWEELHGDILAEAGSGAEARKVYQQGLTALRQLPDLVRQRPVHHDRLERLERKVRAAQVAVPAASPAGK